MSRNTIEKEISLIYLDMFKDKLENLKDGDAVPKEVPVGKKDFIDWVKKIIAEHYPEVSGIINNDAVIKQFCQQVAELIAKSDTKVLNPIKDYKPSDEPTYVKSAKKNVDVDNKDDNKDNNDGFIYDLSYFGLTKKDIENAVRLNDTDFAKKPFLAEDYKKLVKDNRDYDFGGIEWYGDPPIDKFYYSPDGNILINIGNGYSVDPVTKKVYITQTLETKNIDLDKFYDSIRKKYTIINIDDNNTEKRKKGECMYYDRLFPKYKIAQIQQAQQDQKHNQQQENTQTKHEPTSTNQQQEQHQEIKQDVDQSKQIHQQHTQKRDPLKVNKFLFQILKYIPSQTTERKILEYKFANEVSLEDAITFFENQKK